MSKSAAESRPTIRSYVIGYVASIILTLTAYLVVTRHLSLKWVMVAIVIGIAMLQFVTQMIFFLHLGREGKPRWKLFVFFFMLLVVSILVFGSLWIMNNLNYRMTPQQIQTYMNSQTGF
jgi:cytochrome o ubiquinol oxidase operon protein cyoD